MFGNFVSCDTVAKSRTESNGSLRPRAGLIENDDATTMNVYPSGAARATISVPAMPLEPGRLSTMTVCLNASLKPCAISRAVKSVDAPGDCGTMIRIGRDGYVESAAKALPVTSAAPQHN